MINYKQNNCGRMLGQLPTISQMYSATTQYNSLNVIKKYHDTSKPFNPTKRTITRRGHYLEQVIKSSSSPGPANPSNLQRNWLNKSQNLIKPSNRKTYIDEVQHNHKKNNFPSPNTYTINQPWPSTQDKINHISQKLDFVDQAQYESDKVPGVGSYQIRQPIIKKNGGKLNPISHVKPRQNTILAAMNSYNPCPVQFNTFQRIQLNQKNSQSSTNISLNSHSKSHKENLPGPGHYQLVNTWKQKKILKNGQTNYLSCISKGPQTKVYYN